MKPFSLLRTGVLIACVVSLSGCTPTAPSDLTSAPTTNMATTTTQTTTTTTTRITTTITYAKPTAINGKALIDAPLLHQFPEYPTGCEVVTAVMALKYVGEAVDVEDFIDNCLERSNNFYWQDGRYYGPNPYEYFLGNPRTENSYGCMAPVIKKALIRYFGSDERVTDTTGADLSALCKTYIDEGIPVIVWASIGMVKITDGPSWTLPDGTKYTWPSNEHCLLLVGYDAGRYYFNDAYTGKLVSYTRAVVEERYERLDKQSLVVK